MPRFELPKPVRTAGLLLLGLAGVGLLQTVAGTLELHHVDVNTAVLEAKATSLADAKRAAGQMFGSASLAQSVGIGGVVTMLIFYFFFVRAYAWARIAAWILVPMFLFTQVLVMLQDGAVGIRPYTDLSHDLAQQDFVNSMIVWPGYFFLIYPAEAAGLILPVLVIFQLLKEDTQEFFRLRNKVTPGKSWDVQEILAKRGNGSTA